jgi:hypothetical protein
MRTRSVRSTLLVIAGVAVMLAPLACSGTSAAWTGFRVGKNLAKKDSHLAIWLDGQKAGQSTLKKAATGYSAWKIKEPVGVSPVLKFQLIDPDKFGRIVGTHIQIHQEYEGDYSHLAEFIVTPVDDKPESLMKPDTEYDLGKPPKTLKVLNVRKKEVKSVKLKPGLKYKLVLTVSADKSETALIHFKTK